MQTGAGKELELATDLADSEPAFLIGQQLEDHGRASSGGCATATVGGLFVVRLGGSFRIARTFSHERTASI